MPIGSTKTTSATNDKSPSTSGGPGGGGRTTFRPPWVKTDAPETKPKTIVKTTPPWSKKTTTTTGEPSSEFSKKNGEVSNKSITSTKKPTILPSKNQITVKPLTEAIPRKEAKLQSREIKVPIVTEKRKVVQEPLVKPKPKKPPTPSESEEEETETESESESESGSEEATAPPLKREESELERKFKAEKPKLRPVVIKRDKSLSSTQKKPQDDDDDEPEEGDTEEERERQRRFKLERPKLRHVVVNKQKSFNKSTDDFDKIRPVLRKVQKVEDVKETSDDNKPEFKDKILRKVTPIKKEPSRPSVVFESSSSDSESDISKSKADSHINLQKKVNSNSSRPSVKIQSAKGHTKPWYQSVVHSCYTLSCI